MDDLSYTYAKSSPSVGRRGSRAISRLGTRHMSDSWKGLQRYGIVRDKLNECNGNSIICFYLYIFIIFMYVCA